MRQGQQHRRGRGRSHGGGHQGGGGGGGHNNQRKTQNPLSRTYHSNGPDGKVSGTPQSIADKYLSLARDALSSGDPVLAENYLQHAEHYNRIILAHREQVAHEEGHGGPRQQQQFDQGGEFGEDETDTFGRDLSPLPPEQPRPRPEMRQPDIRPRDDQPRTFDPQPRDPIDGEPREPRQRFDQPGGGGGRFNDGRRPHRERYGDRDRGDRTGNDRDRGANDRDRFEPRDRDRGQDRGSDRERFNQGRIQVPAPAYGPDGQLLVDRSNGNGGDRDRDRDRDRPRDGAPHERSNDRPFRPAHGNRPDAPRIDAAPRDVGAPEPRENLAREARFDIMPPNDPVSIPDQPEVRAERFEPVARAEPRVDAPRPAPRRRERGPALAEESQQPDFLRRPVRRPRRDAVVEDNAAPDVAAPAAVRVVPDPASDIE